MIAILRNGGMDENFYLHLIDLGWEIVEGVYEKHCFFTTQLIGISVDPVQAERDACRIEHVISDESFRRRKEEWKAGPE